jgi:hypothetical protein
MIDVLLRPAPPGRPAPWASSVGASRPLDRRPSTVARVAASGTTRPSTCRWTSSLRVSGLTPSRKVGTVHSGSDLNAAVGERELHGPGNQLARSSFRLGLDT